MQSAVAETSSDDAGVREWCSKHQSVWTHNNSAANTISSNLPSTQTAVQHVHNIRNKVSNHGLLEKPVAQRSSRMAGNIFQKSSDSGVDGQTCSMGIEDRLGIWKAASNPNLAALKVANIAS